MPFPEEALLLVAPHTDSESHLRELYKVRHRVVPFIGAGLSIPHGYPTWHDLLLDACPSDALTVVQGHLKDKRYEEAAEEIWYNSAKQFCEHLQKTLGPKTNPPSGAVTLLPRLSGRPILTTNLDPLIEQVFNNEIPIIRPQDQDSATVLQKGTPALLKIHGDYTDKEPVLTLNQYKTAYGHADPSRLNMALPLPKLLEQAMLAGPLLFLGCSLQSDRTMRVLAEVTRRRPGLEHFAFVSSSEWHRRDELHGWKIRPIFFPKGNYNNVEQLLAFLIEDPATPRTPTPSTTKANLANVVQAARQYVAPTLRANCGTIKILDMTQDVALGAVYTAVNILEDLSKNDRRSIKELTPEDLDTSGAPNAARKRTDGLAAVTQHPRLLVYGKPGAGKTTFLKHLAYQCIEGHLRPSHVPLFVTLRTFADTGQALAEYLMAELGPHADALLASHSFLLLDGLDEVKDQDFSRVRGQIEDFATRHPAVPIVMTCRIAAREHNFSHFRDVEMADFDEEQIKAFSTNWFQARQKPELVERFLSRLQANSRLKELANKPLLLTFLCYVFENGGDFDGSRSQLYEDGFKVLLQKWDASRTIERRRALPLEDFTRLLEELAYTNFALPERRIFFREVDLDGQITDYLRSRPRENSPSAELVRTDAVSQFGLLDLRAHQTYAFSHLTFQEFLTARHLASNPTLIDRHVHCLAVDSWREVWLLLSNQLNPGHLFPRLQTQLNAWLEDDPRLQEFLVWVERKAASGSGTIQRPARRAFYAELGFRDCDRDRALARALGRALGRALALALDLDLARSRGRILARSVGLDLDLDLDLDLTLDFDLDCARTLARDLALDLDFDLTHDRDLTRALARELSRALNRAVNRAFAFNRAVNRALARGIDRARAVNRARALNPTPAMLAGLEQLRSKFPTNCREAADWAVNLGALMIRHRDLGHIWNFTPAQVELLQRYLAANLTLANCLNEARNLKQSTREAIESNILVPGTSLKPVP
jgi:hypothetical protein